MDVEHNYEGETYELEVPMEDKRNFKHIAEFTLKNGRDTFKFAHVFEILASSTGKKVLHLWKGRRNTNRIEKEDGTSIDLQPDELERLIALLDNIEEIAELDTGSYIILEQDSPEIDAAIEAIRSVESTNSDEAQELAIEFIKALGEVESDIDDTTQFANEIPSGVTNIDHLIRYSRRKSTLSDFRDLIKKNELESEYQDFLQKHPWMFGSRYTGDTGERKLVEGKEVDFCLETVDDYYDIFEIKRPGHSVLVKDSSHNTYRPSAKLSEAITQVEDYIQKIERNRSEILLREDIDIIRPRGYVVIGSNLTDDEQDSLRSHNSFLNQIEVLTYSDVANIAERAIDIQDG